MPGTADVVFALRRPRCASQENASSSSAGQTRSQSDRHTQLVRAHSAASRQANGLTPKTLLVKRAPMIRSASNIERSDMELLRTWNNQQCGSCVCKPCLRTTLNSTLVEVATRPCFLLLGHRHGFNALVTVLHAWVGPDVKVSVLACESRFVAIEFHMFRVQQHDGKP